MSLNYVHPAIPLVTRDNNVWHQKYTTLEYLELNLPNGDRCIQRIGRFFELNPNIRSFASDTISLWNIRQAFKESLVQLDDLAITGRAKPDLLSLLNELHGKGFYKRLHLYSANCTDIDLISNLNGLIKLHYDTFGIANMERLEPLILAGIKELATEYLLRADTENLAKSLVSLERLCIGKCNYNELIPFIRHSKFLKKIGIHYYNEYVIDLKAWNEERKKLIGNERVTSKLLVYMQAGAYSKFKWANKETSLTFIELRRRHSFQWGHHFASIEDRY